MNVLHHDLKAVEAASFRNLDFTGEALQEVLVDDTIRGSEEGEDMGDEIAFIIVELVVPVVEIFRQVDFLSGPEGSLSSLVCCPDLVVPGRVLAAAASDRERGPLYASSGEARRGRATRWYSLQREKNKSVGVLLQQWLICFRCFYSWSNLWCFW